MKAISKKSMKKPSPKTIALTTRRKPSDPAREIGQHAGDPEVALEPTEHQRESGRADQQEHDHDREARRVGHGGL